jgi:hypothetical protein
MTKFSKLKLIFLAIIFFGFFGWAGKSSAAILIQDNFETDNLSQWIGPYSQGSTNPTYAFRTNTDSYQGSWSFQETIPPDQPEGGALVYQFTSNQQRRVYAKWNQKWSDPWDPLTASKMIILLSGDVPSGPTSADLQIIVDMVHSAGSHLGEFQVEHSNYISGQTQYTNYRQNAGTPVIRQTNRWYTLETLIDAGTPNGNNGIIQLWIDGQLKADYQNLNLLPSSYSQNPLFHRLIVTDYADAVPDPTRTAWYDYIVLATDRISSDTTPPAAPTGLSVS